MNFFDNKNTVHSSFKHENLLPVAQKMRQHDRSIYSVLIPLDYVKKFVGRNTYHHSSPRPANAPCHCNCHQIPPRIKSVTVSSQTRMLHRGERRHSIKNKFAVQHQLPRHGRCDDFHFWVVGLYCSILQGGNFGRSGSETTRFQPRSFRSQHEDVPPSQSRGPHQPFHHSVCGLEPVGARQHSCFAHLSPFFNLLPGPNHFRFFNG
mmetsp:Transcript_31120/g.73899  ORF Transcript_31120/g.73899 Transcript_31120/m.73899 type:complete len:206 (-) Transcript_31120:3576-4193(-)